MSKDAMVEIMRTFFIFSVLDVILIPDDYIYVVLYVCIIVLSFVLVLSFISYYHFLSCITNCT